MNSIIENAIRIRNNIISSNQTIDDINTPDNVDTWLPNEELEYLLSKDLIGKNFDFPPRTRSKKINQAICAALGYPIPKTFKKNKPRFLCQNFDKYAQQSNNLQIWNDSVSLTRRYCIIILDEDNIVINVKVLSGGTLQDYDTTHKLTQKYQASLDKSNDPSNTLLSSTDTSEIIKTFGTFKEISSSSPADLPKPNELMTIKELHNKLQVLEHTSFPFTGKSRVDGDALQDLVYRALGYKEYRENGQLPDLLNQLLEIKKQLSPTVDLGLFKPDETIELEMPSVNGYIPTISDVRYAIFYCSQNENKITIEKIYLVTGKEFFKYFNLFEGKRINKKLQLHLPKELWEVPSNN